MTKLNDEIAAIKSRIASSKVQVRSLTQLELEQPNARPEITSLRRKQRSEHLVEVANSEQLLSLMEDPGYADHVDAQRKAAAEAFDAKCAAARAVPLEMEATLPLWEAVDQTAAPFLDALRALRRGMSESVEPTFHAALQDAPVPAGVSPRVRYEDACFLYVDRVRANHWYANFAFAVFVKQALSILGITGMHSIVKVDDIDTPSKVLPGTFADAHRDALAKLEVVFAPLASITQADVDREVVPAHLAAWGPKMGSQDPEYQAQQAAAKLPDYTGDPGTDTETMQRRLETDPDFVAATRESIKRYSAVMK